MVGRSRRVPKSWGRIGRRLTSIETTRAVVSVLAEGSGSARSYRRKGHEKRGHEGRGAGLSLMAAVQLGHFGRMTTSRDATRAVGSGQADDEVQLGHIGRNLTSSEATRTVGSEQAEAVELLVS